MPPDVITNYRTGKAISVAAAARDATEHSPAIPMSLLKKAEYEQSLQRWADKHPTILPVGGDPKVRSVSSAAAPVIKTPVIKTPATMQHEKILSDKYKLVKLTDAGSLGPAGNTVDAKPAKFTEDQVRDVWRLWNQARQVLQDDAEAVHDDALEVVSQSQAQMPPTTARRRPYTS